MRYDGVEVGPVIRQLRKDRRITVDSLSGMTGLSTSSINQIEQGGRSLSMKSLYLLMEAFGCDANTILHINKKSNNSIDSRLDKLDAERRNYFIKSFNYLLDQAELLMD